MKHSEDFSDCVYGNGHNLLYQDIYISMKNQIPYTVNREDCLKSIRLLHAFYRSDEKNTWQTVNEEGESSLLGRSDDKISRIYRTVKL